MYLNFGLKYQHNLMQLIDYIVTLANLKKLQLLIVLDMPMSVIAHQFCTFTDETLQRKLTKSKSTVLKHY